MKNETFGNKKTSIKFKYLELTLLWNNPTKAIKSVTFLPENHCWNQLCLSKTLEGFFQREKYDQCR